MEALCSSFDLEELDDDEREELEAMLYAQVHHASADLTPLSVAQESQIKSCISDLAAVGSSVPNGLCHSPPLGGEVKAAAGTTPVVNEDCSVTSSTGGVARTHHSCGKTGPDVDISSTQATQANLSASPVKLKWSISTRPDAGTAQPVSQTPTPSHYHAESAHLRAGTAAPNRPVPGPSSSQPSTAPTKRPLSPASASGDEPETKTAALAASGRRARRRQPPPLVPPPDSSSDSSDMLSGDEFVLEATETAARPAAARGAGGSSPEVVALEEEPPPPRRPSAVERGGQRPAAAVRRARSCGGGEAAALRRQTSGRVRTSSDLSSSDDSDGGAALVDEHCDIHVNVRSGGTAMGGGDVIISCAEEDDVVVQEVDDDQLALPSPACHAVLASARLSGSERRQLEPLCASRPCHKWSERQRAGYTTPRHYGPEDVSSIRANMPDDGWDITPEYLQRSAGKSARARYYSNMQRNRCRRCDDVGHVMASCPVPPVCHLCGVRGHTGEFRCPNMFCYMCGRPDHRSQRCPRNFQPVFCALCKAPGHVSEQCPDRWRRYHATTSAGAVVRPPAALESRPARLVYCWQCGERGHHGHHCGDERYTSAACLSQHVISYTETACASSSVAGLVATPAQMDAVFAPRRRRTIEAETGATLTYEKLGEKSWLINFSGSLEAATAAHDHVQAVLQGKKRPRPRPSSAPASPVHPSEPGGATSAPASPEPPPEAAVDGREAARLKRRLRKETRRAERKRGRRAGASAREKAARGSAASPPPVVDVDTASATDDCVELTGDGASEEVVVLSGDADSGEEVSGPGEEVPVVSGSGEEVSVVDEVPGPAVAGRRSGVELVTIVSDDEDLSVGCDADSSLEALAEAGRVWRLRLLDGDGEHSVSPDQQSVRQAWKLSKGQRKRLRKKMLNGLVSSAAAEEAGADPSPAAATAGPSTSSMRRHRRKEFLDQRLARQLKTQLPPAMERWLPPGWETDTNWRQILATFGVPHSLIPRKKKRKATRERLAEETSSSGKAVAENGVSGVDEDGGRGRVQSRHTRLPGGSQS